MRAAGVVAAGVMAAGLGLAACGGGAGSQAPGTPRSTGRAGVGSQPTGRAPGRSADGLLAVQAGSAPTGCSGAATITAEGTGTAQGTPDLLTMVLGVETQQPTASAALGRDNTEAQGLIATLEQGGVAAKDIQTSNLSIDPVYSGKSPPRITGYQVTDEVTVQVHELSSAGSLIDAAASKLGNDVRFDGLSFSITDDSGPAAAAHTSAVHAAAARAKAMAAAAGVQLGLLCSISDVGSQQPQPQYFGAVAQPSGSVAAGNVPLQPGTQQVTADVTVAYRVG
ncbi:MAG: SIMPL domain-containing protein [Acidimicrobiales bacterium]